jgi:AraC-like DNA-binding protein
MAETPFPWYLAALPEVVRAGRFPLDDRDFAYAYRSPTHALHLYDYHGTIRIADAEHALRPGDLTLSPAGVETRYHLPRPGHHWCIHFRPVAAAGEACAIPLHLPLGPLKPRVVDAIARISGLMAVPAGGARLAQAAAAAALQELLLTLASHAAAAPERERAGRAADAVTRAAVELEARLGEELSVPGLARRVGLSQNWLARAFRARYGQTLQRYLLARRVEHAQQLLRTTDLPVARIAERLGFGDAQHFNKQFRRLSGCNPTAYRLRGAGG